MRRLNVFGASNAVPEQIYRPRSYKRLWLEFGTFWLAHPLWQRRMLTPDVYPVALANELARYGKVETRIWARPWWTLQDYLQLLPFIPCRDAVVVAHAIIPDVRLHHYSRVKRKLINLMPLSWQREFNNKESQNAQAGTVRFPGGWYGLPKARRHLEQFVTRLKRRGARYIVIVLDDFWGDFMEELLPGTRRNIIEFNKMVLEVAPTIGAEVLPTSIPFQGDPDYYTFDGVHMSGSGHHILAKTLAQMILNGSQ